MSKLAIACTSPPNSPRTSASHANANVPKPCRITSGKPEARAYGGSQWIGLKSPVNFANDSPASWPSFKRAISRASIGTRARSRGLAAPVARLLLGQRHDRVEVDRERVGRAAWCRSSRSGAAPHANRRRRCPSSARARRSARRPRCGRARAPCSRHSRRAATDTEAPRPCAASSGMHHCGKRCGGSSPLYARGSPPRWRT